MNFQIKAGSDYYTIYQEWKANHKGRKDFNLFLLEGKIVVTEKEKID